MITIKTIDLINDFKRISNYLEENNQQWVTVSRPRNKNIVLMTEREAHKLARAKRELEYLHQQNKAESKTNMHGVRLNAINKIIDDATKAEADSNLTEEDWGELEKSRTNLNRQVDL